MDGDGQDDAAEIPRLLELAWAAGEPSPLVAGIRTTRRDRWSRRLATKFANGLRQGLLHDGCPDTACGLKAFRRDVFLRLPAFEGMHRFLPALFQTLRAPADLLSRSITGRGSPGNRNTRISAAPSSACRTCSASIWLRRRTRLPRRVVEE